MTKKYGDHANDEYIDFHYGSRQRYSTVEQNNDVVYHTSLAAARKFIQDRLDEQEEVYSGSDFVLQYRGLEISVQDGIHVQLNENRIVLSLIE